MKLNKILIIDVGNSYTKFGISEVFKDHIERIEIFKTNKRANMNDLEKIFDSFFNEKINCVVLGSVVPDLKHKYINLCKTKIGVCPYTINKKTKFSFSLNDDIRSQIGDDLLALAQYCSQYNKNIIGFSFGTSIAAIYLKNNNLEGVLISPGLSFGLSHLINNASMINENKISLNSKNIFGNTTRKSLEAGIYNLKKGIITSAMSIFSDEEKKELRCIISGGEASNIDFVDFKYKINKEAILLGFKEIYLLNVGK